MRLDKYLQVSRLIKRRTVANEACDNERVTVNGKTARASYEVKEGDVICIRFGQRTLTVEVVFFREWFICHILPNMVRSILKRNWKISLKFAISTRYRSFWTAHALDMDL